MIYGFDFKNAKVYAYPDKKVAQGYGNGQLLAETALVIEERCSFSNLYSPSNMIHMMTGKAQVFRTNREACEFLFDYAKDHAERRGFEEKEMEMTIVKAKEMPRSAKRVIDPQKMKTTIEAQQREIDRLKKELLTTKIPARKKRGRVSQFEGKRIFTTVTENPRRETETVPSGYHSMSIIMKAGKRGIKYDDFIAKGGRSVDLTWDLEHGNITVS